MKKEGDDGVDQVAVEGQSELDEQETNAPFQTARKTLFSTLRVLTLLPASTSSKSRPSSSYSHPSPTYSHTLHPSWTPSDTALSLVTRVVLRAQAGWVGSLGGDGVKGEQDDDEPMQGNEEHERKSEHLTDADTSSSPAPSQRESTRSPRKRAPFPVPSPSKSVHKPLSSSRMNTSSNTRRQSTLNGSGTPSKGTSTPSQVIGMGKGKSKATLVPTYSLTRVESFDLLCLALGLLLNWASGGIEGEEVSEGMGRIPFSTVLNPACSATRGCAHICSCPTSSQEIIYLTMNVNSPRMSIKSHRLRVRSKSLPLGVVAAPLPLLGYTAVLLGLLCTSAPPRGIRVLPTNRSLIFGDVPLESLIGDVQDFLALYDDLEGEFNSEGDIVDVDVNMGSDGDRLCSMGRGQGGGRGRGKALEKRSEDIARGVLRSLEALRGDGI
ncbi:uncharacterized protein EDB91DRAFT_553922 [Suillus paluster]|uniref:uncharacterized protein n=1 Tax=Suillus paluster TaxID=48578 RepID=UPI001B882210|nr:uncharacterized protein EDB91DRAFT_553922 [Suillus paluster]KAG1735578.1 hypothetical protein EDB91DRAFT_553922 [Suillus paluster]